MGSAHIIRREAKTGPAGTSGTDWASVPTRCGTQAASGSGARPRPGVTSSPPDETPGRAQPARRRQQTRRTLEQWAQAYIDSRIDWAEGTARTTRAQLSQLLKTIGHRDPMRSPPVTSRNSSPSLLPC